MLVSDELHLLLPLLIAMLAGGMIGLERELRHKVAGIGTNMLICAAAALFTILSARVDIYSPSRIAANILTGVGFIGAGLILRDDKEGNVHGLTTAAGIWMAAAIGMAFGYGYYLLGGMGTLIAVWAPRIPGWFYNKKARDVVANTIGVTAPPKKEPTPEKTEPKPAS